MTAKSTSNFWWLKKSKTDSNLAKCDVGLDFSPTNDDKLTSLAEYLENERQIDYGAGGDHGDVDIGTIIEEINRIAAQSPLGPFDKIGEDRSVDDLMKEAEKIYNESSKSFEQLSQHSATSHNISEELNTQSSISTPAQSPTPHNLDNLTQGQSSPTHKSISPLLQNIQDNKSDREQHTDEYSDDFTENNKSDNMHDPSLISNSDDDTNASIASLISPASPNIDNAIFNVTMKLPNALSNNTLVDEINAVSTPDNKTAGISITEHLNLKESLKGNDTSQRVQDMNIEEKLQEIEHFRNEAVKKDNIIEHLIDENNNLKEDVKELQVSTTF